jgi:hypothetical protein
MKHRGRLLYNGRVVLDDIRIGLDFRSSQAGGGPWGGRLTLPPGASVQAGGPYDLVLFDGRTARVLMRRSAVNFGHGEDVVEFLGSGPIERTCPN